MGDDKRKRTRVPVEFDVAITAEGKTINVRTSNISLTGLLCKTDPSFKAGNRCSVVISLTEEVKIDIPEAVVIRTGEFTAVSFTSLTEDGFFHLRRLVELNADDSEDINSELTIPAFR